MMFEGKKKLMSDQLEGLEKSVVGTWTLTPEGKIDIDGNFSLATTQDYDRFWRLSFGRVTGNFDCSNRSLVSLYGGPEEVGGDFRVNGCGLTTLEGGPAEVGGSYDCSNNRLEDLVGAPESVGGDFVCYDVQTLKSLAGAPHSVGGEFNFGTWKTTTVIPKGKFSLRELNRIASLESTPPRVVRWIRRFLTPEEMQKRIDNNPTKALADMEGILHLPEFKGLRWPSGLGGQVDTLSDLSDIGV